METSNTDLEKDIKKHLGEQPFTCNSMTSLLRFSNAPTMPIPILSTIKGQVAVIRIYYQRIQNELLNFSIRLFSYF